MYLVFAQFWLSTICPNAFLRDEIGQKSVGQFTSHVDLEMLSFVNNAALGSFLGNHCLKDIKE
jgi:hypothetical protein